MAPGQHGQRVPVWSPRGCAVRAIPGTGRARASRWECCSAEQPGQVTDQHGTGPALPTSQMHASGVDRAARCSTPRPHRGDTVPPPPRPELVPRRCTPTPHRSSSIRYPHHLGVGRCLTHRPGRTGNPGQARWGAPHRDRQRPRLGATVFAAPVARSGAAAPRPDRGGRRVAGRASICYGWAARPCCRGQAAPDPLAWQGRQSPSGALVTVPRGSPRRPIHVTGAAAPQGDGRGTPRPCTGWASIPSRAHARRGSAVRCLPSAL
jgi:hypothetical protein